MKKNYVVPSFEIIKIDTKDIVCTSGQGTFSLQSDAGYEEENW